MKEIPEKTYLGDSVYAEMKYGFLVLTTENGLPEDPSNKIMFEPEVYEALKRFVDKFINETKTTN